MIESITLKNFRSYKDARIEFHPNVNIIIGENDSGKTNILRAIDLVVNNHPSGTDYISDWGGDLQIDLEVDGKVITRARNVKWSKKYGIFKAGEINEYRLIGEKEPFKAFGLGVPDLIKKHLNISPTSFAFQLEGPFLLNKSAADVARHYNNIVNLDIIDTTISNIAGILRKERGTLKIETDREKILAEKLSAFDWLEQAESDLIDLEKMDELITKYQNEWSGLRGLVADYKRFHALDLALDEVIQHEKTVEDLLKLTTQIEQLYEDEIKLESYLAKIEVLKKQKEEYKKISKCGAQVDDLIKLNTLIEKLTKEQDELSRILAKWNALNKQQDQIDQKLIRLEAEFKKVIPNTCPIFNVQCVHIDKVKSEKKQTSHSI